MPSDGMPSDHRGSISQTSPVSVTVIDLIVTILKARSEGIRKGDRPRDPLKLILRRTNTKGDCVEEEVLVVESTDSVIEVEIEEALSKSAKTLGKKTE